MKAIPSESLAPLPSSTVTTQSTLPFCSSCTSNVQSAVASPVDTQLVDTKASSPVHSNVNVIDWPFSAISTSPADTDIVKSSSSSVDWSPTNDNIGASLTAFTVNPNSSESTALP